MKPLKAFGVLCKKRFLLIVVVFLVLTTFGLGPLSVNLYTSTFSKDEVGSSHSVELSDGVYQYTLNHYYQDAIVNSHVLVTGVVTTNKNAKEIIFKAVTEEPKYSGNFFLPFYKDFEVKYTSQLKEEGRSQEDRRFGTEVNGTLKMRIIGLCTISEAKKIAEKAILESVNQYNSHYMSQINKKSSP